MTLFPTLRRAALGLVLATGFAAVAHAQHGGGPGGGGGGMHPGGGGFGGPGGPGGGGMMGGGDMRGEMGRGNPGNSFTPSNAGPVRNGPQLAPPGRWWDDKKMVKTLSLRNDQQRRMDDIFNANKTGLVNLYANLRREEDKLSSMSREDLQDEAKVFAGIDRVAQARADVAKANAHILLQIRKELDAQQLVELDREVANLR